MKLFISAPASRAMSDALWALRRPLSKRSPKDTQYLFPWVKDVHDNLWLVVDTEYAFDVDKEADAAPIVAELQPYEDSGALPKGTLAALTLRLEALRGGRMVVYDEFPPLFKQPTADHPEGQARTLEELIAAGQFAQTGGMM